MSYPEYYDPYAAGPPPPGAPMPSPGFMGEDVPVSEVSRAIIRQVVKLRLKVSVLEQKVDLLERREEERYERERRERDRYAPRDHYDNRGGYDDRGRGGDHLMPPRH